MARPIFLNSIRADGISLKLALAAGGERGRGGGGGSLDRRVTDVQIPLSLSLSVRLSSCLSLLSVMVEEEEEEDVNMAPGAKRGRSDHVSCESFPSLDRRRHRPTAISVPVDAVGRSGRSSSENRHGGGSTSDGRTGVGPDLSVHRPSSYLTEAGLTSGPHDECARGVRERGRENERENERE